MFVVFAQPSSFPTFATQSSLSHLHHLVQPIAGRAAAAARNMRMVTLAYSRGPWTVRETNILEPNAGVTGEYVCTYII